MKQKISIVLFEEHENVNFYSIVIDNNDIEILSFFNYLISQKRNEDAKQIVNLLTKIGQNGAQERYFRYEGKITDHVCAIPGHYLIKSDCRLYCLRLSETLLLLGNGGIKRTKTYQEDQILNNHVRTLQEIDKAIMHMIKVGDLKINGKTISGKLSFYISI